ncbi:MAG: L,D-transpeptidase, partial [Miltoncostaeaceae bacterium]
RYESIAGRPFTVTGSVVPARDGERVLLEGSRNGRAFQPLARMVVRKGRVSGAVRPDEGGRWRFRLRTDEARSDRSDATAPRRVFDANPHRVPASEPVYIVQKLSEAQLYYYERGHLARVFPVVFGKPSTPTPVGTFRVYSKTPGPGPAFGPLAMWYHGNYGIHGTNQEYLLGRSWRYYSAGCTRNYNANIIWLYDRVPIGTPVRTLA